MCNSIDWTALVEHLQGLSPLALIQLLSELDPGYDYNKWNQKALVEAVLLCLIENPELIRSEPETISWPSKQCRNSIAGKSRVEIPSISRKSIVILPGIPTAPPTE